MAGSQKARAAKITRRFETPEDRAAPVDTFIRSYSDYGYLAGDHPDNWEGGDTRTIKKFVQSCIPWSYLI